jgi:muramidase (phage lysozyme)
MAINPQKLLPPPSSALVKVGKIKTSKKSENNSTDNTNTIGSIKKELEKIKENLEKIYSLVLDNNKLTEKDLEVKRLSAERLKFAEKEKRLEEKNPEKKDKKDDKSIPKLGFFDRINRFIMFTLLGWVGVRLVKYLPKLIEFTKNIGPVMEFFSSFTANIFTGIVDFIDWGYKAHDNFREFIGELGGEPFQKAFDDFSSNLNKFVNLAIIAGIAASGGTDFGLGKKPGKPGTQPKPKPGQGGRPKVTTSGGGGAGRPDLRNPLRQKPRVSTSGGGGAGKPDIRNPLRQKPRVSTSGGGKIKLPSKGSIRAGGIASLIMLIPDIINSWSLISQGRPKDGIRTIISAVAGVGAGMAAMAGVTAGAAALGITGVGLPAAIALAIAGFAASSAASWAAYEGSEALLKRMGLVDKDPETNEPYAYKSGGHVKTRGGKRRGGGASITRGGKQVGGAIRRQVRRVLEPPKATPIYAGRSVGGKEKLQEMFPEAEDHNTMNPYGHLTETSKMMTDTNWLGPVFNLFAKTQAGDLPTQTDYKRVGTSINGWVNAAIAAGGGSSLGYSNGGVVNNAGIGDISKWLEKSAEELFQSKAQQAIRDLRKNLTLESSTGDDDGVGQGPMENRVGSTEVNFVTSGEYGSILDLIASVEAVGGYDVINGGKIDGLSRMTIADARRSAMRSRGSGAMGRYQQMPKYVLDRARSIGLNPDRDLFSPENQDKLAILLINGAGYKEWKSGRLSTERFAHRLSATWRGLPEGPSNKTYQDRYASRNKAHTTWSNVISVLNSTKDGRIAGGQVGGGEILTERGETSIQGYNLKQASHPETGSGWTVDGQTDANGRPIVFSKEGAAAFARMMKDSGGIVTGKDIASSQRSPAKNRSVGGAERSLHLSGIAMDIHNASGRWIRQNGAKYGWVANDYSRSHGGHFEFGGPGSDSTIRETGEGRSGGRSGGGGMWGFGGFGGFGFSGFGGWGFSGFGGSGGSSKNRKKGKGSGSADSADIDPSLEGKDKKIYLHWNAAPYTNPIGPYHTVFLGDGKKVQHADYNTHRNHTDGRNTNAIGLAIAAMHEGSPTNWKNAPTSAQINAMVSEAANIAKSMGWNASDINKSNIMTHAEAAFLDGYGLGSGDSQTRWDLITLRGSDATSGNLKKPGSKGGNELRGMIRQKMKYGGPVGESNSENTRNSLNYTPSYESHQETQVVFVPIEKIVQVPVLDSGNKAISFGGVNSIIDPTKYSFSYTG